ncbi:MAG: carboxyl transferase domain-containing protein [Burkholderiaceae bacterium]
MIEGPLLVANRGEIAIRILRSATDLGLQTVAVASSDDAASPHLDFANRRVILPGRGVAGYLDGDALVAAARDSGARAIHPGYGFVAENEAFAARCAAAGLVFVGPDAETLGLFGDKGRARALAARVGVPTLPGTQAATSLEQAREFMASLGGHGAVMVKALAGGGGRGMRVARDPDELATAFASCAAEASQAFGCGDLFVERFLPAARHLEVQIAGDGSAVTHLWERDCSLQRRRQKLVEFAPAPWLAPERREALHSAALMLAGSAGYRNLGTIEFLLGGDGESFFIEANPRLQVEHTVTEAVTGLDLVALQLRLAGGASLSELGLRSPPPVRGMAVQMRINAEILAADGSVRPSGGEIREYAPAGGPGVRVDACVRTGWRPHPAFDTLLAKLIVQVDQPRPDQLFARARRALAEFRLLGPATNIGFLRVLLDERDLHDGLLDTGFVETRLADLLARAATAAADGDGMHAAPGAGASGGPGASIDRTDPLAVIAYGHEAHAAAGRRAADPLSHDPNTVAAPLQGTVVSIEVAAGQLVPAGATLAIVESMKMEHLVCAERGGRIQSVLAEAGDTLWEGQPMLVLEPADTGLVHESSADPASLDTIRPDLAEVLARRALTEDASRPESVARRRGTGQRTARENVADLVDAGTFIEYGPLVVAAQRRRREIDDLVRRTPADGLITGVGRVNGDLFDDPAARVAVMAYDYTVLAGTQGVHNHWKTDRILDVAERGRLPLVLFGEGGGGRPGDIDYGGFVGQNTFWHFGRLSGLVPMVGIVSGRCFAGNAALMGACDVIIATANTNIGMGGPAMIEGGGLGVFAPEDIGPLRDQFANGVVDVAVADEAEAVSVARRYLGYFQGRLALWQAPDQRRMRQIVPENRLRVYAVRDVIETLADQDTVLELRAGFGRTMVTAFARLEGRPIGIVANDPGHLGGAIDSDGADKAVRFMQLCDAFDIPLVFLCDTPGIMVGPEAERTALVRHAARMFVTGNNLSVPTFTVVLRKAYGLGAIAMAGGNFDAPYFTVSWPTGEFGPMGLEGQVKLGFRKELEAIADPQARRQAFDRMVAAAYQDGKALERSTTFAVDDTIDPAQTRDWLLGLLAAIRPPAPRDGKKHPYVDAW